MYSLQILVRTKSVTIVSWVLAPPGSNCIPFRATDSVDNFDQVKIPCNGTMPVLHSLLQVSHLSLEYRVTSLTRTPPPVGPYSSPMPRALWCSYGGGCCFVSEVPLYSHALSQVIQQPSRLDRKCASAHLRYAVVLRRACIQS